MEALAQPNITEFTRERFQVLATEIAQRLGWTVHFMEERRDMFCKILDPATQGGFYFEADQYNHKGRLVIASSYPTNHKRQNESRYPEERVEITVSQDKDINAIMSDIQRRFLPKFREYLQNVLKRNQSTLDADNLKKSTLEAIGKALGRMPEESRSTGDYRIWVDEKVRESCKGLRGLEYRYNGDLKIELELSKDDTLKLIEFLKSL